MRRSNTTGRARAISTPTGPISYVYTVSDCVSYGTAVSSGMPMHADAAAPGRRRVGRSGAARRLGLHVYSTCA